MTHQEVLEKAISKAIDNEWEEPWIGNFNLVYSHLVTGELFIEYVYRELVYSYSAAVIIYNHDFAKALWPGYINTATWEMCQHSEHGDMPLMYWHLQQMVIADDPIQYLGENM